MSEEREKMESNAISINCVVVGIINLPRHYDYKDMFSEGDLYVTFVCLFWASQQLSRA